ncbi:TolC family outer membrane protein [Actimicrobium sp. CCC2.4]|uniref:TolC family outer membrane protein n=1 Tax=Actimicrobium sp. CCC2.4 TaxID=3048606 RepID=UPI002AC9714E|nr:TolC family outer membrane protein [Actimicrobium sp. CCC2.4]MEB0136070.1 TolC family outer membrane protein [Actimicrobium sp. CCC2.4]WPX32172.1 TolC family outer membrane protein [Actimicrobium sp. CCC2.4]
MRYFVIAPLLACAFLSSPVRATDLLQVYRDALVNDAVIASARSAREAGQERSVQGRAGLLPVLGVGGSYNRVNATAATRSIDYNVNTYALTLTQPLLRMANWETYQQGKLSVAISDAVYAQAQQDLIARVAQAYFDVLAAQDVLAFLKAQESAISEQLASAKRNFEVGTATITDSNEAQARYDLAIAQQIAAQNDLDVKIAALQQIIGKPAGTLATLRPGLKLSPPEPAQMAPWVSSAEEQNFGVLSQQLALEIARRDISRNRDGHLPTVDLIASRGTTNQSSPSLTTQSGSITSSTVGVQWQIPLFAGFAVTSKVRESIALEEKARADLDNIRRIAAQAARQSYLGVNSGLAQVRAYEAAEISSLSALESNRLGYQVGVRINIDVLNAQQQLFSTRQLLAKARYDTLIAGLRLKAAAGTLKEDDLALVNGLLQN